VLVLDLDLLTNLLPLLPLVVVPKLKKVSPEKLTKISSFTTVSSPTPFF
jgi:hypothetical protein